MQINANEQLLLAAAKGDTAAVMGWLEQGADINTTDSFGRTPILSATHHNEVETVQALIAAGADLNLRDHGADVNLPDRDDVSPLQNARVRGFDEIAEILVVAGAIR
ncbi:ankyrin repeat protein [Tumebacillus sp. BK434]|uniref:ankyrin repeat domain-containing protein n=1 Tax=Tumebacillus sp. BK434 TaxID=2512169 RepID=UPI001053E394|nr:ankyrin repeat domain-containing protein [Tumebacillus sp. BK434]TCP52589.1 ankyrin repeat protein [Tumebacillus sp. BK434]